MQLMLSPELKELIGFFRKTKNQDAIANWFFVDGSIKWAFKNTVFRDVQDRERAAKIRAVVITWFKKAQIAIELQINKDIFTGKGKRRIRRKVEKSDTHVRNIKPLGHV